MLSRAEFFSQVYRALMLTTVAEKAAVIASLSDQVEVMAKRDGSTIGDARQITLPGQPARLQLVHPRDVKQRKLSTVEGRACFLHAIAHIEFNAINLALDAVYRFRDLPVQYYADWLRVASDESRHHQLVVERIQQLGHDYGDFPAHNGLWDIARQTSDSLLGRMALVPCVLEARGLDVTPPMIGRLEQNGEQPGADILKLILEEEVEHVAIGIRWFQHACREQDVEPVAQFMALVKRHLPDRRQGPFNKLQRRQAGFSDEWMEALATLG